MERAVFFDRDGVVNEMYFEPEHGVIDSPLIPKHVNLVIGFTQLLKGVQELGFKTFVISNQPVVGLKKTTEKNLEAVTDEIKRQLAQEGLKVDNFYYCLHHPFAKIQEYQKECECRKPNIGLFKKASEEFGIDLSKSWMVGDGVNDVIAGKNAGCKTILLASIEYAGNFKILEQQLKNIQPDFIVKKPLQALEVIKSNS